jgi:hypothetical protein
MKIFQIIEFLATHVFKILMSSSQSKHRILSLKFNHCLNSSSADDISSMSAFYHPQWISNNLCYGQSSDMLENIHQIDDIPLQHMS